MPTALLVDDEPNSRNALKKLLQRFCPKVNIVAEASNIHEAVETIMLKRPEIVFLDIEMPGENGFALFKHFPAPDFNVIFATAYDQYAVKAFQHSAVDYLLKPINFEDLIRAVAKVKEQQKMVLYQQRIELMLKNVEQRSFDKLALPTPQGFDFVEVNQIIRCQGDDNYTNIFLTNGSMICATMTMKAIEEMLPSDTFFRTHRSDIINLKFIRHFNKKDGGQVVLDDGTMLPIARRRKEEFLNLLNQPS